MKKALIAVVVVAAMGGSAFATNSYLVQEATEQVQVKVSTLLSELDKELLDVQLIKSEINGNKIKQDYAIYFTVDGERSEEALYIEHSAEVGPFALNTNGSFSFLKDRGLAKLFIKDVASVNEVVRYSYTASNGVFDVDATFDVGSVAIRRDKIIPGQVVVKYIGDGNNNDLSIKLASLKISGSRESMAIGPTAIKVIDNDITSNVDFSMEHFRFEDDKKRNGFIDLNNIKLMGHLTGDKFAELVADITVDKASINTRKLSYNDAAISFKSHFENINVAALEEIADILSHDQGYEKKEKIRNLWKEFYAAGMNAKSVELHVNNSKAIGDIHIKKADYSNVSSSHLFKSVMSNLETNMTIELDKPLVKTLGIDNNPKKLMRYFYDTGEHYSTNIKVANGKVTANGLTL